MDAGKLRDKAASAVAKGKHRKALEIYEKLSRLDPDDGMWPRKEGEMHRHLEDNAAAVRAFERACERYAAVGFVVKAVGVCKMIIRIDPTSSHAREQLVAYNEQRGIFIKLPVEAAEGSSQAIAVTIEVEDAPLEMLPLHKASVGAKPRLESGKPSGIFEIPIELEMDDVEIVDDSMEDAREALVATPLFEDLPPASLRRLISEVDFVELAAGETLFRAGDEGTTLYVVVEGRISVLAETDGEGDTVLGELREGDFFGELGVVTKQPRSATVRALVDCELLAIRRQLLVEMIQEETSVLTVLLRFLRERLVRNLMVTSPLFAPFLKAQRQELVRRFGFLEVEKGTSLLRQGEHSPALFVVLAGQLGVDRTEDDGTIRDLATLGSGDIFGEMSLLAQAEAVATVRADTKCLLLELPRDVFRETIMTHPHVLAFVGDLASDRERQIAAVAGGHEQYEELHLDLF
tara:strand:- start:18236 stop:19621 length:1386 start_codon:yes stop_codon:yes gene_type:complete